MNIKTTFATAAFAAIPALVAAESYHYIDLTGTVETIEAPSAAAAMSIAAADDPGVFHSGVKLDLGLLEAGDEFGLNYVYVDANGDLQTVVAASADAAFILASGDIAANSGVVVAGPTAEAAVDADAVVGPATDPIDGDVTDGDVK